MRLRRQQKPYVYIFVYYERSLPSNFVERQNETAIQPRPIDPQGCYNALRFAAISFLYFITWFPLAQLLEPNVCKRLPINVVVAVGSPFSIRKYISTGLFIPSSLFKQAFLARLFVWEIALTSSFFDLTNFEGSKWNRSCPAEWKEIVRIFLKTIRSNHDVSIVNGKGI